VADIRAIRVPRSVELIRVPARHAPLDEVLAQLEALEVPQMAGLPPEAHPYLEVRVRLDAPEPGLRARVEAALAEKPVRLARIDSAAPRDAAEAAGAVGVSLADLERLAPETVFERLCAQRIGADAPDREALVAALQAAFVELSMDPAEEVTA
jgi:exonuclease SbcD